MNKIMFSLAIADLLVGIVFIPQTINEVEFDKMNCRCFISINVIRIMKFPGFSMQPLG